MSTPYDGKLLMVTWRGLTTPGADPAATAALLRARLPNVAGVMLKTSNGVSWQGTLGQDSGPKAITGVRRIADWVEAFAAEGLEVHVWGVPRGRQPDDINREAEKFIDAANVPGVRSLLLDVEHGEYYWQGTPLLARALMDAIRRRLPQTHIGLILDGRRNRSFEYWVEPWLSGVDSLHPMVYPILFGRDRSIEEHLGRAYDNLLPYLKPIYPMLQSCFAGDRPTPDEILHQGLAAARAAEGMSFYRLGVDPSPIDHRPVMDDDAYDAIAAIPWGAAGGGGLESLEVTAQEGIVTAPAGLNLRSTPTTAGGDETIIRRLPVGSKVAIIERLSDEWLRVRANGDTGFVFAAYVTLGAPPPPVPPPAQPRPSVGFQPGMNVNIGVHPPDVERLRGLSWVRFVFIAADRRQSVDDAFNATYGPLIREYAAAGIRSLIILNHETEHGNVPWSNGDWAAYAPHFGRAARRVAELCAPFGDMVAFQIWNEEDSGWSADAGNPNPSARGIRPEDFALVVDAAAANIRAAAPQAKIVAGGLKTGPHNGVAYLRAAVARLGRRLPVDAIACHPYGRYVSTDPFYGKRIGPLPEALAAYRNAFPDYPLWITEIGIPGEDKPIGPEHYDKIALYMREFVTEVANNHGGHVPVLIWFAWTDRMNNAGILTTDGREKAGIFQAFQAMKARGVGGKVEALESALEGLEAVAGAEIGFVAAPAGLNLRTRPVNGDVITILLADTPVELLELVDGWYRVRAGDLEGFVSAEWVTTVPPKSQATTPAEARAGAGPRTAPVVGIHGAPGGAAPPRHLWDTWVNFLKEMGIRWYKQCETGDDTGNGSIFQWVLHLKRNGIEPIVRYLMNAQFPSNLDERFIRQMARYANEGVHWAEIGNEPNLAYEWQDSWRGRYEGQWPRGRWVEEPRMRWGNAEAINTLARVWVEDATRAANAGAWPAFYAFGPTDWGKDRPHGHYSSTLYTDLVVARLASHHRAETIRLFRERRAWIAVHVAKYEKSLDFDPYSDDPHRPWDMSLRGYEIVLGAFRRHFGGDLNVAAIPIISTEGGVFVPDHRNSIPDPGRLPANDEEHARQTIEMFRYVEEKTPLTAMCPWCIAEGHAIIGHGTDLFRHHGWFKEENGRLIERPVLSAMRRRRQELEKGIDLTALAAGGLESLAAPEAPTTISFGLDITVTINGGEVSDVSVAVQPTGRGGAAE